MNYYHKILRPVLLLQLLMAVSLSTNAVAFSQPDCTALTQWAANHNANKTISLTPKVVISGLFADDLALPVFNTSPTTWSLKEFNQVRGWLNDCRRTATKNKDKVASNDLYKAYKVVGSALKPVRHKEKYGKRGYQAVDNLVGYHRSNELITALQLAEQALQGSDVKSQINGLTVTRSVKQEVLAVQNSRDYLTSSDIETLSARLKEATGSVKHEMTARTEEFEALKQELDQVPMTLEGAQALDRLLKNPVLTKMSRQESMDFQNAVFQKRQAISQALRQQKAEQKKAAEAIPVDITSRLKTLISGDDVEDVSLQGIKPGISYLNAKKYMSTRLGLKAGTGEDLFKEFAPTIRQVSQYKSAERRDGGVIRLETMKDMVGQVKYFEHFTGQMDFNDPFKLLKERLGKPQESKFLGNGFVWSWKDSGINIAIMTANQSTLPYRSRNEYKSSLVIRLWSDEYIEYLTKAQERCNELQKKPMNKLSAQDKVDILQGCKN